MNTFDMRRRTQSFVQQSRRFSNPFSTINKTQILLSCVFIKDGIMSLIERPEEGFRIINVLLNGNMNRIKTCAIYLIDLHR